MAEFHDFEDTPSLEDQFRSSSRNFSAADGDILIKYWHMNKLEDMEAYKTSHHLYGEAIFPKYLHSNVFDHDYACIRTSHQEEDLWKIFKKHGVRALAPPNSIDSLKPIKSLKNKPIDELRFNFIGAMHRTSVNAAVVEASTLLNTQVILDVERRAKEIVQNSRKRFFGRVPGL